MPQSPQFRHLATALALVFVLVAHTQSAHASLFIVDTVAVDIGDHNPGDNKCEWHTIVPVGQRCTLRAAVEEANAKPGKDTILFPAHLRYEMIVADDHDITEDVVIGSGVASPEDRPVLDANGLHRMFEVAAPAELTLEKVVITDGWASLSHTQEPFFGLGGAIMVHSFATLKLERVVITGNRSEQTGAAVEASGGSTVSILDSTFEGNSSLQGPFAGVISLEGVVATISGSTIARNSGGTAAIRVLGETLVVSNTTVADNSGDGILTLSVFPGQIALQNVTISGNSGNGLTHQDPAGSYAWTVTNSIIAGNSTDCVLDDLSGFNAGHNLDSDGSCGLSPGVDIPNTNPLLGPLGDNGGWSPTKVPLVASPVINQGNQITCPSEDQRGAPRTPGAACELGAVELLPCVASHGWLISGISIFYTFEFETCFTVDVGPDVEVVAGGSPTFRTRDVIRFHDGFSVLASGEMTAIIDPTAGSGITLP